MMFGAGLAHRTPQQLEQLELDAAEPAAALTRLAVKQLNEAATARYFGDLSGESPETERWRSEVNRTAGTGL
jgi:hypothetical protein